MRWDPQWGLVGSLVPWGLAGLQQGFALVLGTPTRELLEGSG